jgi:hypothetical protein
MEDVQNAEGLPVNSCTWRELTENYVNVVRKGFYKAKGGRKFLKIWTI